MSLTKGVTTGDERQGFFIVHGHTAEGLANVSRRRHWIVVGIRALGIDVDQAHLHSTQWSLEFAIPAFDAAGITFVVQPLGFRSPINQIGFPVVFSTTGKSHGLEAHRFERHVAGKHHEVCPGQAAAILLLDRPHQAPGLVEVGVIGPAVEWFQSLLATSSATTSVGYSIGTRAVPGHTNEERTVVAVVCRPPGLRGFHQRHDLALQNFQIDRGKGGGVVKVVPKRVGLRSVLPQWAEV